MSNNTRPKGLIVRCHYCKSPIQAERHEYTDPYSEYPNTSTYPYPELKGIEWDYVGHMYACKSCMDEKRTIMRDDLLKSYEANLSLLVDKRVSAKKNFDKDMQELDKREAKYKMVAEELKRFSEITHCISEEVQSIIVKEFPWKEELKEIFSSVNQSSYSASL